MLKTVVSKVAWVGRTASMVFGLALVMALLFGVATMAMGATGGNFLLGKKNVADAISTLVKQGPGPALSLVVEANQPPLKVNSSTKVANLNADQFDGKDISAFDAREVIDQGGPLPLVGTYTSKGGTLIISASGSGFRSLAFAQKPGAIGMNLDVDSILKDSIQMHVNQRDFRTPFVADTTVVEGLPAGTHTIRLAAQTSFNCNTADESSFNPCTTTNSDDRFNVTVVEIPD